ncbi:MerR family transcriptional regulator [Viridibacterium curvum]|uniref:HTH merR-type domain-containing protein n=1 Tax=Viridibacterium curvum TaxID=1101404 RepID=A0ABP9QQY7_9RHOO
MGKKLVGPLSGKPLAGTADRSGLRSGAVARMLGMPVTTLRVWERRYALTRAALSASGQRLYSADDVQRLALIKQLVDRGHAIGSLAGMDISQLQGVAATHARTRARTAEGELGEPRAAPQARPWRLAVIGAGLARRIQRSRPLLRRLGRPLVLLGPFESFAEAAAALPAAEVDAVLCHAPQLHAGWLDAEVTQAPALAHVPRAVLYGFAADSTCEALAAAGFALLREPQPDAVLAQWLRALSQATPPAAAPPMHEPESVPPVRWDVTALADFAVRSSTIACECPRHVAELLAQLTHFEAYSAQCENRSAADAELHGYLRRVAAAARARFESALEYVALHEGLPLPAARPVSAKDARGSGAA